MTDEIVARTIRINGIVQGVGFRPFVYQLAHRHDIRGTVANTGDGVIIHAEGTPFRIDAFRRDLEAEPPPLSRITELSVSPVPLRHPSRFTIELSAGGGGRATLISPDVSICEDCRRELFDPEDRRFGYPFINCTNCGPRYTIIDDIPYDRPHTSMRRFPMCSDCQAEYDDPADRRFHAQPNACPVCGPRVWLADEAGRRVEVDDPIQAAAGRLLAGEIVAVKGLGGFHLAVDPTDEAAVARLRRRKRREEKPFALMAPDMETVRRLAAVSDADAELLTSPQRPILLLPRLPDSRVAPSVAPGNRYFGVMLPYTPLHYLLFSHLSEPTALVMTSGNLSNEPIAIDNAEAVTRLGGIADAFLLHDRDILLRSDDSILRPVAGAARAVRRSRGYVPVPVFLDRSLPPVLAVGAELKNTVCLTRGDQAFLSQHIGDMETLETFDFFQRTVDHLRRILDVAPERVAHDLHPDYLSTGYARVAGLPTVGVQHHHAHIVSCMAENRIDGPVIGLAFDGTGYGTDGRIWGGEVLIAGPADFTRVAHLAYVPMPGAAAAIREPWRMAISYLIDAFGEDFRNLGVPLTALGDDRRCDVIRRMVRAGVNAPLTSSLGRLFDGVAAMAGLGERVSFEGQAAMTLEMVADMDGNEIYDFTWERGDGSPSVFRIPPAPIVRGVVDDLAAGVPPSLVSGRFHRTLIRCFADLCGEIRRETGIDRVAMSGGAFQNAILLTGLISALEARGLTPITHCQVPANDGGISLGQAVVAGVRAQSEEP